jgi:8-amino-7-oxononanoate synthase
LETRARVSTVLSARWQRELEFLARSARLRALRPPAGWDFTSNDYLGLGAEALELEHFRDPWARRTSGMASRLLRGHLEIWEEVEQRLAQWHGAEAVLMLTSGYVANEGLLSTVIRPNDWVASDESNHASIVDGLKLTKAAKFLFRHNDLHHLEEGLQAASRLRRADQALFIVTESIFSMDGDRAPLSEMVALAQRYEAELIVDEAHATGCFGSNGSGLVDELGLRSAVLATIHTGGKALGCCGAYICGSRLLKEYLVNRCRHLIFTTALPPAVAVWWMKRLDQVQQHTWRRSSLHEKARAFRKWLREHAIEAPGSDYIVPIIVGSDEATLTTARELQEQGYDVRAIRPPSVPPGTSRLRVSIHADHPVEVLEGLASALGRAYRAM